MPIIPGTQRIAVFRPNAVGDFVFALPALHALKRAYTEAELIYLGKPWHKAFLEGRPGPVDRVLVVPPVPGMTAGGGADGDRAVEAFIEHLRALRLDIAIQLYGGGKQSNPFVKRFGARRTVGMKAPDAEPLDDWIPYIYLQSDRLRFLEVVGLVGASTVDLAEGLAVTPRDREEAAAVLPPDPRPLAMLQPGASDPRRRWPASHYAALGDRLHESGAWVAVNGTTEEHQLVRTVIDGMRAPAIDLAGRLTVSGLLGLLERCALLVSNDTGPLHLAQAIGTPTVGIYWLTNLLLAGPFTQKTHRAALSYRIECPVCGRPNVRERCRHDPSFVADIDVESVLGMALELLGRRAA